jgi:hypothetical protein
MFKQDRGTTSVLKTQISYETEKLVYHRSGRQLKNCDHFAEYHIYLYVNVQII